MKYVYPAIFTEEKKGYSVNFPDVEGCFTCGNDLQHSIEMAKDALCLTIYELEENGEAIPRASFVKSIALGDRQFVSLIDCDTDEYKRYFENKSVKKTLTIPFRLNLEAEKQNINFSQVLQEALKKQLGL